MNEPVSLRRPGPRPPWWTSADEAELELLVCELVEYYFAHRSRCSACVEEKARSGLPCEPLREALGAVVEWAECRHAHSKAEYFAVREVAALERLRGRAERLFEEEGA